MYSCGDGFLKWRRYLSLAFERCNLPSPTVSFLQESQAVAVDSNCSPIPDLSLQLWQSLTRFNKLTKPSFWAFTSYREALRDIDGCTCRPDLVYPVVRPLLHSSPLAIDLNHISNLCDLLFLSFQLFDSVLNYQLLLEST